jgi:DNA-binding NarL/FixJ family response regulator
MNKKLVNEERKKNLIDLDYNLQNFKSDLKSNFDGDIDILYEHINNLPEKYINIFKYLVEGEKIKNISLKLNLKINTVKSLIFRGRLLLEHSISGDEL